MSRIDNPWAQSNAKLPWLPPESNDEKSREIPFKVWDLADVFKVAQACLETDDDNLIVYATDDCRNNIQALEWEARDVAEKLLLLLPKGRYQNSQWCKRSYQPGVTQKPEAVWMPCDAYALKIVDSNASGWSGLIKYYFKLCLSVRGTVVLMVSAHT